jgi:hypothetical protein
MAEQEPPSRWGAIGALALGLLFWFMVFLVFKVNGTPEGYGFFEVVILPVAVGGFFIWRGLLLLWKMMRWLAFALLFPTSGFACAMEEPFHPADLALAPVVVTATLTSYEQDAETYVGTMQVQVTSVMKGEAPADLTLEWSPMMSEWPPEAWDRETSLIVAAVPPLGEAGWQLAMETCGSVWLLPDTPANRDVVADAIRGQS